MHLTYSKAKEFIVSALSDEAQLHEAEQFARLGAKYDEYDSRLPRTSDIEFAKLHIALEFWGGWLDARNHVWLYYDPITKSDWPILARTIIEDITADREVTDPLLLKRFGPKRRSSRWSPLGWLRRLVGLQRSI